MDGARGVILDVDGTLIDSNEAHARAWVNAFGREGLDVPIDRVRPLIGMGGDQLVPRVTNAPADSARYERLKEAWKEHFAREELPHVRAQAGARDLIVALRERGVRVILGTSSEKELLEDLLHRVNLADLQLDATTATDVEHSKPEPDIIRAALEKLNLPPERVLMIGDTAYDVEAARRARVSCVMLRCGGDDRTSGAARVYADPADLLAHLDDALASAGTT